MSGWKFEVCEKCGMHGRVVDPDNHYGLELASKEDQFTFVDLMIEARMHISTKDLSALYTKIQASTLPERSVQVNPQIQELVLAWNELNMTDFVGDPAKLHEMVLRPSV